MEGHRLNKKEGATPVVGEVVLVVGDEKNRGEWKKGKVSHLIQGKDGIVRGVILFHKGHTIERPLQLVCPLEIRGVDHSVHLKDGRRDEGQPRNQRVQNLQLNRQLKGLQYKCEQKRRTKTELFISCMRILKIDSFNF